jgi:serine O-acetyltransferase
VEANVCIYANATILGGNTVIGKTIIIGNSWVTKTIQARLLQTQQQQK